VDISSYFNSVNVDILLPKLREVLSDDLPLYAFFASLLKNPYAIYKGEQITEQKGILPGVSISTFLANLYLCDLDLFFYQNGVLYLRYSDDIVIFDRDPDRLQAHVARVKECFAARQLSVNPKKEAFSHPHEGFEFLGFFCREGEVDICASSLEKLKGKIRRKTRALTRWAARKGVSGEHAAKALIRKFNAKFFDNPIHNELTWARWFFPIITTDKTLHAIDSYMQDSIRFLATQKRTNARFSSSSAASTAVHAAQWITASGAISERVFCTASGCSKISFFI
jgi:hypothetical protein